MYTEISIGIKGKTKVLPILCLKREFSLNKDKKF